MTLNKIDKHQSYDFEFPSTFPDIVFENMVTNNFQTINSLYYVSQNTIVLSTHESCNRCFQQFYELMNSNKLQPDTKIIFIFPEGANNDIVEKYKSVAPEVVGN